MKRLIAAVCLFVVGTVLAVNTVPVALVAAGAVLIAGSFVLLGIGLMVSANETIPGINEPRKRL